MSTLRATINDAITMGIDDDFFVEVPCGRPDAMQERMMQWFEVPVPPTAGDAILGVYALAASDICKVVQPGPERTVALRKLLESRDAAMRALQKPGG